MTDGRLATSACNGRSGCNGSSGAGS